MTRAEAVDLGRRQLELAGLPFSEAALDAELLLRHAGGWTRAAYLADIHADIGPGPAANYTRLIARRAKREPVAYITGTQEFWGRPFMVTPAVLIPRPETELIIDEALIWASARRPHAGPPHIVDVGTGSGCLAITLACELSAAQVTAVDISAEALAIAELNAQRHGVRDRIHFVQGSLLEPVIENPGLIVANPPYVADRDRSALPPEVVGHEPALALFGGANGLQVIRELLAAAAERLRPDGYLIVEFGAGQADAVRGLIEEGESLRLVRIRDDLQGIPRTVVCQRISEGGP